MQTLSKWVRCTRAIRCPICQHGDWCSISGEWVVCMRVESQKSSKNGGWVHRSDGLPVKFQKKHEEPKKIDAQGIWMKWNNQTTMEKVESHGVKLGVSADSLLMIQCVWANDHFAWAYPMKDGENNFVGIRLRNEEGRKWAVTGSRQGLFIPCVKLSDPLYICEGPTDTAAALSIGLCAIGKPSCNCNTEQISILVKRNNIKKVVIVSDQDEPGLRGAETLSKELKISNCIILPPAKDMREFVNRGGTKMIIETLVGNVRWK